MPSTVSIKALLASTANNLPQHKQSKPKTIPDGLYGGPTLPPPFFAGGHGRWLGIVPPRRDQVSIRHTSLGVKLGVTNPSSLFSKYLGARVSDFTKPRSNDPLFTRCSQNATKVRLEPNASVLKAVKEKNAFGHISITIMVITRLLQVPSIPPSDRFSASSRAIRLATAHPSPLPSHHLPADSSPISTNGPGIAPKDVLAPPPSADEELALCHVPCAEISAPSSSATAPLYDETNERTPQGLNGSGSDTHSRHRLPRPIRASLRRRRSFHDMDSLRDSEVDLAYLFSDIGELPKLIQSQKGKGTVSGEVPVRALFMKLTESPWPGPQSVEPLSKAPFTPICNERAEHHDSALVDAATTNLSEPQSTRGYLPKTPGSRSWKKEMRRQAAASTKSETGKENMDPAATSVPQNRPPTSRLFAAALGQVHQRATRGESSKTGTSLSRRPNPSNPHVTPEPTQGSKAPSTPASRRSRGPRHRSSKS